MADIERTQYQVRTRLVGRQGQVMPAMHEFGGDGPTVLFAHATGMHGRVWQPVVDHLVDRARCVALDLRGHGDSAMPADSDLTGDGFGSDVLTVAHELACGGIIGVGHSLGGAALLMAELAAPGTFQRLFLYEPAILAEVPEGGWGPLHQVRDVMVGLAKKRRATFASTSEAIANYARKPPMALFDPAALNAYVEYGFADAPSDDKPGVTLKCTPEVEAAVYSQVYANDVADRLGNIACPVILATGSDSDPVHRGSTPALAARFGSVPVVLANVGHFAPMQNPPLFAAAVATHALTTST